MRKILSVLLSLVLIVCIAGCQQNADMSTDNGTSQSSVEESIIEENINVEVVEDLPLKDKVICVDAGHGLNSYNKQEPIAPNSSQTKIAFASGTRGKNQTEEELNLSVALKLEAELKELGASVHMTRTTHESDMTNIDRAEFANKLNADVSVKIHADGIDNSSAHGVSMLVPSNQYINNQELCNESRKIGEIILDEVVKTTGASNRGVVTRSDLTGFNWTQVPIVLLEMGFMTNPEEDAKMETEEYQQKIVDGIVNGLLLYFES